jgi:hypothetical protein
MGENRRGGVNNGGDLAVGERCEEMISILAGYVH